MRAAAIISKWLGYGWMALFALSLILSILGMFMAEPTLALGWRRFAETFSPYNLVNTFVMVVVALPGIGLLKLSDYFASRADAVDGPLPWSQE